MHEILVNFSWPLTVAISSAVLAIAWVTIEVNR